MAGPTMGRNPSTAAAGTPAAPAGAPETPEQAAKRQAEIEKSKEERMAFAIYFARKYGIPKWLNVSNTEAAQVAKIEEQNPFGELKLNTPISDLLGPGVYRNPKYEGIDIELDKEGNARPIPYPTSHGDFIKTYGAMMDFLASATGGSTIYVDWNDPKYCSKERISDLLRMAEDRGLQLEFGPNATKFINSNLRDYGHTYTLKAGLLGLPDPEITGKESQERRDAILLRQAEVNQKGREKLERLGLHDVKEERNLDHLKTKMDSEPKIDKKKLDAQKQELIKNVFGDGTKEKQGKARFDAIKTQIDAIGSRLQTSQKALKEMSRGVQLRAERLDDISKALKEGRIKTKRPGEAPLDPKDEKALKEIFTGAGDMKTRYENANQTVKDEVMKIFANEKKRMDKLGDSLEQFSKNEQPLVESLKKEQEDLTTKLAIWKDEFNKFDRDYPTNGRKEAKEKKEVLEQIKEVEKQIKDISKELPRLISADRDHPDLTKLSLDTAEVKKNLQAANEKLSKTVKYIDPNYVPPKESEKITDVVDIVRSMRKV